MKSIYQRCNLLLKQEAVGIKSFRQFSTFQFCHRFDRNPINYSVSNNPNYWHLSKLFYAAPLLNMSENKQEETKNEMELQDNQQTNTNETRECEKE